MRPPQNRRVFVVGYAAATALGRDFATTWQRALAGEAGFRRLSRCVVETRSNVVGEIPDWNPAALPGVSAKEALVWNAGYIFLTVEMCRQALADAGLEMDAGSGPRTACLIGSALNGSDAYRTAMDNYTKLGPLKVSPYLLPNLCANVPAGKAGMSLGFTGPIIAPEGACATGNHAIALAARMIQGGDADFALAGGVESCLIPEIILGFTNMLATIKVGERDRAYNDPGQASRPFSLDRKGFVLAEGAGVLLLAAEDCVRERGLRARAEIAGLGWNSDAHHITRPRADTVVACMQAAIADAGLRPEDIGCVSAHGTSTKAGDSTEAQCLRAVFGPHLPQVPITAAKSQIGHSLGAAAAIEAALAIESMQQGLMLPTINHIPDPELADLDLVANQARRQHCEHVLSNAFGFGGTNCCLVLRGL